MTKPEAKERDLEQQMKELEAARDSAIADLQRVAADFDNYPEADCARPPGARGERHERLVKELLPCARRSGAGARSAAASTRRPSSKRA